MTTTTTWNTTMMMIMVGALLLTSTTTVWAQSEQMHSDGCSLCADGAIPESNESSTSTSSMGGLDCRTIAEELQSTPSHSNECRQMQQFAFQHCHCPSFPPNFCPLCENAFLDLPNLFRPIPPFLLVPPQSQPSPSAKDTTETRLLTCSDVLFGDRTVPGQCEQYARATAYCGCPKESTTGIDNTTTPTNTTITTACHLCAMASSTSTSNDSSNINILADVPISHRQRRLPPDFRFTCRDYQEAIRYAAAADDHDYNDETSIHSCSTILNQMMTTNSLPPVNLPAYCGCAGTTGTNPPYTPPALPNCTLCPSPISSVSLMMTTDEDNLKDDNSILWNAIIEPWGITCEALSLTLPLVTDSTFCAEYQSIWMPQCCAQYQTSNTTTTIPTPAPILRLTSPPSPSSSSDHRLSGAAAGKWIVLGLFVAWVYETRL